MDGGIILLGMGIFLVILLIVGFLYIPSAKPTTSTVASVPGSATNTGYFSGVEDELSSYFSTGLASTPAPTTPDGVTSIAPSEPVPEQPVLQKPVPEQPVAPDIPATVPETAPPAIPIVRLRSPEEVATPICAYGSEVDHKVCVDKDRKPSDISYTSCPVGSKLVRVEEGSPGTQKYIAACLKTNVTNTNNLDSLLAANVDTLPETVPPVIPTVDTVIEYKLKPVKIGSGTKSIPGVAICPAGTSNNMLDNPFIAKGLKDQRVNDMFSNISQCWDKTTDYIGLAKNHSFQPSIKPISCVDGGAMVLPNPNGIDYRCLKCPVGTSQISIDGYCMP